MDAMPVKELIAGELRAKGRYCALGVVGARRGIDLAAIDPYEYGAVAKAFDIAPPLAREIAYINDSKDGLTPAGRWKRVRAWVNEQLKAAPIR